MNKYFFYAKTNPAFLKTLENELETLGIKNIKNLKKDKLNYLKFNADCMEMTKILLKSRLIEDIKVQIVDKVKIESSLKTIKFENFLPFKNSKEYKIPEIKAKCFRSKIFHERMVNNIIATYLNKFAFQENKLNENNEIKGIKKIEKSGKVAKNEKNDKIENKSQKQRENELTQKLNQNKNRKISTFNFLVKDLPKLEFILQQNNATFLFGILNKPLHLHGYRLYKNWGSLRETFAASLLFHSNLLKNYKQTKQLFLWDPFCGSGTILLEALLYVIDEPVRQIKSNEDFLNLPFVIDNKAEIMEYLKNLKRKSLNSEDFENVLMLGSDIDVKSIDSFIKNCDEAKLKNLKINEENQKSTKNEIILKNPNVYNYKVNECLNIFIGDFELIAKEVIFTQNHKFSIVSNIPYGLSEEMSAKQEIRSLYKRFGKFLRKYSNLLENVFILVNKRNKDDSLNFERLTEIKWETVIEFENNGIPVEFIKMKLE